MGPTEQKILNPPWRMTLVPTQQISDVILSYRIEAESGRVLYALSMPEYIEAWLRAPDALRFVFDPEARNAFRIDVYRGTMLQSIVHSSCRIVSANQVHYQWKSSSPFATAETLVEMHLRSNLGGCILGLKHSGFQDAEESTWCDRMWHQSLEALCRLMAKSRTGSSH